MIKKEILLSIYPKYNDSIRLGIKNYEFRSFNMKDDSGVITMWVYETFPTKSIKYKMLVKNPITKLLFNQNYGLGNDRFSELISQGKFAYEIVGFEELLFPITLEVMKKMNIPAPQGYLYIKNYPKLESILIKSRTRKIF